MEIDYMRKAETNNILRIDNRDYRTNDGENSVHVLVDLDVETNDG